jgi:2-oxoisovalerate dehydrogenase E1 component beta subunit
MKTIYNSVAYSGCCIIILKAARNFGAGAEIAANLAEHALQDLKAPVVRVCGSDTVMPLLKNEHYYLPSSGDIVITAAKLVSFS